MFKSSFLHFHFPCAHFHVFATSMSISKKLFTFLLTLWKFYKPLRTLNHVCHILALHIYPQRGLIWQYTWQLKPPLSERLPQVSVQEVVVPVPKTLIQEVIKNVPVPQVQTVEKIVEVPQVQTVEKVIEIPQVQVKEKVMPVPQVVTQEVVRQIPRVMTLVVSCRSVLKSHIVRFQIARFQNAPSRYTFWTHPEIDFESFCNTFWHTFWILSMLCVLKSSLSTFRVRFESFYNTFWSYVLEYVS